MKAIETTGRIDKRGFLKLHNPLRTKEREVKVVILIPEENEDENQWLSAMATNPAFDFLKNENEDIYSVSDGKPFKY